MDTVTHSRVIDELDMHQQDEDHLPYLITQEYATVAYTKGGHPPLDRRKLQDPEIQKKFRAYLSRIPLWTWNTELNDHASALNCTVMTAAQDLFRKEHIILQNRTSLTPPLHSFEHVPAHRERYAHSGTRETPLGPKSLCHAGIPSHRRAIHSPHCALSAHRPYRSLQLP